MLKLGHHLYHLALAQWHYSRLRHQAPFDFQKDVDDSTPEAIQSLASARPLLSAERKFPLELSKSPELPAQWPELALLRRTNVIAHPSGALTDPNRRFFSEEVDSWEKRALHRIIVKRDLSSIEPSLPSVERAFWLGRYHGHNYYHWLLDILPRLALAYPFIKRSKLPVAVWTSARFQVQSLQRLFPDLKFVSWPQKHAIHLKECFYVSPAEPSGITDPRLLQALQAVAGVSSEPRAQGPRIWIDRPANNRPVVPHSDQLDRCLTNLNFTRVRSETLSFIEQLELFKKARYVAGGHGAGLSNLIFTPPQTPLLEVSTAFFGNGCFARAAAAAQAPYKVITTDSVFRQLGSTAHCSSTWIRLSRRDERRLISTLQSSTESTS